MKDLRIEPSMGATYGNDGHYAVYEYSTYPRHSVLSGRTCRTYLNGGYDSPEAALRDFPTAVIVNGSGYQEDLMLDLPGDDDPDYSDVDLNEDEEYNYNDNGWSERYRPFGAVSPVRNLTMLLCQNVEVEVRIDDQDWITITNRRSGASCRVTIAGNDILVGSTSGKLLCDITPDTDNQRG